MNRYDFVYVFDVRDANPNGDPDAGNLPRIDPETGHGLVTDVCIKRKIRNYVALTKNGAEGHRIYFQEGAVLNDRHDEAWKEVDPKANAKKKKTPKADTIAKLTKFMCANFWDIRTFGAVMSTEINCGQVRGPVQISFARSVDPIVTLEHAITRSSVTNQRDLQKGRTMGRKFTVPYAVYVAHGYVSGPFAEKTDFSQNDLELLWEALLHAFDHDASAARPPGSMAARKLIIFEHGSALGDAPAHRLFEAVSVRRRDGVKIPRSFEDYEVAVDEESLPEGMKPNVREP